MTEPNSPQQKGVAERMNQTLAEAFSTVTYIWETGCTATAIKENETPSVGWQWQEISWIKRLVTWVGLSRLRLAPFERLLPLIMTATLCGSNNLEQLLPFSAIFKKNLVWSNPDCKISCGLIRDWVYLLTRSSQIWFLSSAAWPKTSCTWAFPLCILVLYGERTDTIDVSKLNKSPPLSVPDLY